MGKLSKKLISIITAVVVISGIAFTSLPAIEAKAVTTVTSSSTGLPENPVKTAIEGQVESYSVADYGLTDKTKDGVILHAFCWSFKTIQENMADIANAGYSTVQTSPANTVNASCPNMKILGNDIDKGTDGIWWWHYQPTDWKIGNYQLGSREEFKTMCAEADKYGIKIIVDVLPNHTTSELGLVAQELKNSAGGDLYHANGFTLIQDEGKGSSWTWGNRLACTTGMMGGLPDVNTENKGFQEYYLKYVNDVIACGGDGFRYDTAKHIGVPSDPKDSKSSENDFWPVVTGEKSVNGVKLNDNGNLFIYGEILQDNGIPYSEYASYMEMTASEYGDKLRGAINSKNFSAGNLSNWSHSTPDKIVTWVESHDTYFNKAVSRYQSDWNIKMCWAVLAARAQGTPLFFSRPDGNNNGANWAGNNVLGAVGDKFYKDTEVAAANKFRNAMVGQPDYMRNPNGNSQILQIDRGTKGTCIINLGGDTSINNDTTMAAGTYTDQVSGGTFTVSGGKISGQLKGGKIATIYNPGPVTKDPTVGSSVKNGSNFKGESLELTLSTTNSTSATYTEDGEAAKTYTNGQKIRVGQKTPVGGVCKVYLKAIGTDGKIAEDTFTFTKKGEIEKAGVYFNKPSDWGTPTVYVYDDSVTPVKTNNAWPGVAMTDNGDGEFYYEIPAGFTNPKVIFVSGSNQFPAAKQPGHAYKSGTALSCDGSAWEEKEISGLIQPTVGISQQGGTFSGTSLDVTLSTSNSTSATYSIDGGAATTYTNGKVIPIGANTPAGGSVTVTLKATGAVGTTAASQTYTFTKEGGPTPTVKAGVYFKKPSGWGTPTVYVYDDSTAIVKENSKWPGAAMTLNADGQYYYEIPAGYTNPKVIFTSGSNQIPGAKQPGHVYTSGTALTCDGSAWTEKEIVIEDPEVISGMISTSAQSPQVGGQEIGIATSEATGGTGTINYKFEVNSQVKSDFSQKTSYKWTPTEAGTYTIKVTAMDTKGKIATTTKQFTITAPPIEKLKIESFTTTLLSPQILGQTITLNSTSSGGKGTILSKFAIYDVTASRWNIIKDFGVVGPVTWKPTKAGKYILYADVKDETGKIVTETINYVINVPVKKLTIESFTTSQVSPQVLGQSITLNSVPNGGTGTILNKFAIYDGTATGASKWTIIKEFGTVGPSTWKPTKAGTYILYADVKDATGKIVTKTLTYVIKAAAPITITNIVTDKVSPQAAGKQVKITATGKSSNGLALTYNFSVHEGIQGWKAISNGFTTSNVATWTPTEAGIYTIWVEAKDTLGNRKIEEISYIVTEQAATIANTNPLITYTGNWTTNSTSHYTKAIGAEMSFSFTGTAIKINGIKGTDKGIAFITIDGEVSEVDLYAATSSTSGIIFQKTGLASGVTHTISIQSFDVKNDKATATTIGVNSFEIVNGTIKNSVNEQVTTIANTNPLITYTGSWTTNSTSHYTKELGAEMSFSFTGTSIKINGIKGTDKGIAFITIDGEMSEVDLYAATSSTSSIIFQKTGLTSGTIHTIKIEAFDIKNDKSIGTTIGVNSFDIVNGAIK